MKKYLDILVWALLLFLITPSGMALASWNAVPGDSTYAWKLSLEQVLLKVLSPSDKLQSATQVKIAERRFNEFQKVATSQYAAEGIVQLNQQLAVTTTDIKQIKSTAVKTEARKTYVATLKKMSADLEEQKRVVRQETTQLVAGQGTAPSSKTTGSGATVSVPTTVAQQGTQPLPVGGTTHVNTTAATESIDDAEAPAAIPPVSANPQEVAQQIEQTQSNIEQIIQELEEMEFEGDESEGEDEEAGDANGNGKGNQGNGKGQDLKGLSPDEKKEALKEENK